MMRRCSAAVAALALLSAASLTAQATDSALVARARAIHERVLTLDTHVDINPVNFAPDRNYTQRLPTQVNLPKMEEGGLDAVFFSIYVGQSNDFTPEGYAKAHAVAMAKFASVHRLAEQIAPDRIGIALTAAEVRRIYASGRKVALMGVENGYGLGTDVGNVKVFFDQGARYLSLAHNGHNQLSDSNTGERDGIWQHNGLSRLGRQVITELNRLGIMIDISHPSKQAMMQTLAMTQAPIIASHSAVRGLCNHSRNLDDEQLLALKQNGGVVQLVAFNSYVKCGHETPERQQAQAALLKKYGVGGVGAAQGLPDSARTAFQADLASLNREFPPPARATVKDFVDHVDYTVKLIGIDHAGISSDFDGGGGIEGWSDASETFNVTLELVRRGYTEAQIAKLWSGNLLRVMEVVEKTARKLAS